MSARAIAGHRLRKALREAARHGRATRAGAAEVAQVLVQIGRLQLRDARATLRARRRGRRPGIDP